MAYTLPQFNLLMDMWLCAFPTNGPATYTNVPCQKYSNPRRFHSTYVTQPGEYYYGWLDKVYTTIRFGRVAPFAGNWWQDWSISCLEVPTGSSQYWRVSYGEVMHEGFPNEYNVLYVVLCDNTGKGLVAPMYSVQPGSNPDPCL